MSEIYKQAEQFVIDSFKKAGIEHSLPHLLRTEYWLLQLEPNASEEMRLAALLHDVDRFAHRANYIPIFLESPDGFTDKAYLEKHQTKCGEVARDFLKQIITDEKRIQVVVDLIVSHEVGGSKEKDLIKDADSISFFENNAMRFATKYPAEFGTEKVRDKFNWMFDRISSETAKDICRNWYQEALSLLNNLEKKVS